MEFNSEDRELLRDLFSNPNGLAIYHFHEKYQLAPGQLSHSIRKFEALGILKCKGQIVVMNDKGREWVMVNSSKIFSQVDVGKWKIFSEGSEVTEQDKSPYIPKKKLLNREFFSKFNKD